MDDAVRTVVEATRVGAWYRTLLTVAALEPDAVRAVAEDVLADNLASAATDVRSSTRNGVDRGHGVLGAEQ